MADFSNGAVSVGKILLNPNRLGETEPAEIGVTIHNQQLLVKSTFFDGRQWVVADYDVLFGPYPAASPNPGEIYLVEGPDNNPEVLVINGYAVGAGQSPVIQRPYVRVRSKGTQFAVLSIDPVTSMVVYLRQTGTEDVHITATMGSTSVTEQLIMPKLFVLVKTPSTGGPSITSPANVITSNAASAFYEFALNKADDAGLRW